MRRSEQHRVVRVSSGVCDKMPLKPEKISSGDPCLPPHPTQMLRRTLLLAPQRRVFQRLALPALGNGLIKNAPTVIVKGTPPQRESV